MLEAKDTVSCGAAGSDVNCNGDFLSKGPVRLYYETGSASKFLEVGRMFLGGEINEVIRIKLDMQQ
jgi:hypothetical protein